jgi:hypothetical protein
MGPSSSSLCWQKKLVKAGSVRERFAYGNPKGEFQAGQRPLSSLCGVLPPPRSLFSSKKFSEPGFH